MPVGDPETQPVMMRLRSPLTTLCEAALAGTLAEQSVAWDPRVALGVVMAAHGYPGDYRKHLPVSGLPAASADLKVFHAGTTLRNDQLVTSGGRVLCVVGMGDTVSAAAALAYEAVADIRWEGRFFRRDIGYRAIAREHAAQS